MGQNLSTSPALGFTVQEYYEYLLLVNPGKEVFKKVMTEKEIFSFCYKVNIAKKTLPHITVANFLARKSMEETVIKWMREIFSNQHSFDVMLDNFSGFPSSHTVYARVQNHEPFNKLASSLRIIDDYVRSNGFPPARIINYPHMTIARRLQPAVYDKALKNYSEKTFNANFPVNELILLKRLNQYDKCKQVAVFKLASSYTA